MKSPILILFALTSSIVFANASELCLDWELQAPGTGLPLNKLSESSGLAFSEKYPRAYHINDSGSDAAFFITDYDGSNLTEILLQAPMPRDTEDLSVGPCFESKSCIFIGDIGDNLLSRKTIQILLIEEQKDFAQNKAAVLKVLDLKYPNGPHNAEAMGVHPKTGDLYLFTKSKSISSVYRIERALWETQTTTPASPLILKAYGQINIGKILSTSKSASKVTGLSIHSSGKRFALSTYSAILEIEWDFTKPLDMADPKNYSILPNEILIQQEALAYKSSGHDIVYTSEVPSILRSGYDHVPMRTLLCRKIP